MSGLGEKLYSVTDEDVKCVRRYYGKREEEIRDDCELIKTWMGQQSHLPDDYDSQRIERFLLRNKFRIEQTKKKLENYYTGRGANIELLRKMDTKGANMQKAFRTVSLAPLPKLYNNIERIYFQQFTGNDDDYTWIYNSLVTIAALEMELKYEYAVGIRFICDFKGLNLTHLKTMGVNEISRSFFLFQQCFSARILSIEYINTPPVFNLLMDIIKLALPEKLVQKINIHENIESLINKIPVEYLPSDYGGKLRTMGEINEDFKQFLMENREHLMERLEVISDESKRIGDVAKNDLFGVDGSFKNINLD